MPKGIKISPNRWVLVSDEVADAYVALGSALMELVERCDGEEGVRADGSNIQTIAAHATLETIGLV
jgi:hypothetical protein